MVTKLPFVCCLLLTSLLTFSQLPQEEALKKRYAAAKYDETKILVLGQLAEFYSIYRDNKKADSILEKQMLLAEVSQKEELILQAINGKAIDNIAVWSSKETFNRATAFLQKALSYAKEQNNTRLEAIAHLKLAALYRKRKQFDASMEQITLALLLLDKKQDSLKAALYLELGDAFLGKGDAVAAYKNYNSAYDISYSINNVDLQSASWHRFARLYTGLGDTLLAKNALLESLKLNKNKQNLDGLFTDYTALFKQTDELEFLESATSIAYQQGSFSQQLLCKRLMLSYIMVIKKDRKEALAYLEKNPDLRRLEANEGLPNYNVGAIHHYAGEYAEAVRYYLLDEPLISKTFDPSVQLSFYTEVAKCYKQLAQTQKAIEYYEKAFAIGKEIASASVNADLSGKLSGLYAQQGDYKNAFTYTQLTQGYQEELKRLAKQREVTLLGLEREKRRHEVDLQAIADEELRRRNLQYTGISMATAFLFIVLIVFGMFPISKTTIRMLNFFSFICLFEFIILLIDNWLHHITHAEPLKIWLAKIFIIAILLPLHHSLEHLAIKFLSSQKLQRFRKNISIRRIFQPSKKRVQKLEKTLEESTLV